jgi:hypothetical protein
MKEPAMKEAASNGATLTAGTNITAGTNMQAADVDVSSLETFSTIGKEVNVLDGYQEAELISETGRGCLTHMWFGGDWPGFEKTRIRVYVDGETTPSIDMEMGLGHGYGFGADSPPWGTEKMGKTGHPSGVYNAYKIPFGSGIRVTAQRSAEAPDKSAFWWIIRGTKNLPVTFGGMRLPPNARLRLYTLENHAAEPLEEFNLCDAAGSGALCQVAMQAESLRNVGDWKDISYLEAIMRAYTGGASEPVLLSSGLEDYFLGTYYFNRGLYANSMAGLTYLNTERNAFSGYRFHDDDPVFFQNGFRLTCRCGEELNGAMLHDPPPTVFTVYTWLYQW